MVNIHIVAASRLRAMSFPQAQVRGLAVSSLDTDLKSPPSSFAKKESSRLPPKTVRFSPYSEAIFVPKDDKHDVEAKFYSASDYDNFRQTLIRDARRASEDMEDAHARRLVTKAHIYACVGLEIFMRRGLARQNDEAKRAHVQAVLLEQDFQRRRGASDPERLSRVSETSSTRTKERAHKLAVGYSEVLAV